MQPEGELEIDGLPLTDGAIRQEIDQALIAVDRANNATLQRNDGHWVARAIRPKAR